MTLAQTIFDAIRDELLMPKSARVAGCDSRRRRLGQSAFASEMTAFCSRNCCLASIFSADVISTEAIACRLVVATRASKASSSKSASFCQRDDCDLLVPKSCNFGVALCDPDFRSPP